MQKRPSIHTINNTMNNAINIEPPSYAEAVQLPASTRNNLYVSTSNQPVSDNRGCSQIPSYPLPTAAPNFYSNIPNQPAYNPAYVSTTLNQQNQPADTLYLANTAVIERTRGNRKCVYILKLTCKIIILVCAAVIFVGILIRLISSF